MMANEKRNKDSGFTIIELIVAMGLLAVLMGIAAVNLVEMANPALSSASEVAGFVKRVRAKGLATTSAYTIQPTSINTIQVTFANTCNTATQTVDPELNFQLRNSFMTDISWDICFNSRGFPNANVSIPISDSYSGNASVEVLLGGAVRVQ